MIALPEIIQRPDHIISRSAISDNALKVLYRLKKAGYAAHLVGGGVRDLLLSKTPKDFDIATEALPEEVLSLFRNCRLIGRRFRLAHVRFGREIIEVATFRASPKDPEEQHQVHESGRILRDNVYGSVEEDAWRRDFTINALYYNIRDFSVTDYVGGIQDISSQTLRLIGDPAVRFREDPVRMLRAVRFTNKLDFSIHPETEHALINAIELLRDIPPARLFDEVLKLFHSGYAVKNFDLLQQYGLLAILFPQVTTCQDDQKTAFIRLALKNTDQRIQQGKPVNPSFLFTILLWKTIRERANQLTEQSPYDALQQALSETIMLQIQQVSLPKRYSIQIREICTLQSTLEKRSKRPLKLLEHPRFRAAYDLLLLRCTNGEVDSEIGDWWTELQEQDDQQKNIMIKALKQPLSRKRNRGPQKK